MARSTVTSATVHAAASEATAPRTDAIAFCGGAVDIDAGDGGTIDQSLASGVDPSLFTCGP